MLSSFYTLVSKYMNNNVDIDKVNNKFNEWKKYYEEQNINEIQNKENIIRTLFQKRSDLNKQYEKFLEENDEYKKKFENSSKEEKQQTFENWINYHERELQELINMTQE